MNEPATIPTITAVATRLSQPSAGRNGMPVMSRRPSGW